jgi:hypothetical protein
MGDVPQSATGQDRLSGHLPALLSAETGFATECDLPNDASESRFVSRGRSETNLSPQVGTELALGAIRF